MSEKLPPGHGVGAHKDKMGKVMHEFKRGQLHSGTGKKGRKGKVVTRRDQAIAIGISESKHVEQLMAMGYSEEAAILVASFTQGGFTQGGALSVADGLVQTAPGYIESEKAGDYASEGPLSDVDSKPGKQKGNSGRKKESEQGSVATFPTVPHSEGPMIKASKGKCPPGTRATGGGFCKNPKAGKAQFFDKDPKKGCPPGSKTAGKGRCRADFSEFVEANTGSTACPPKKTEAEKQAEKAQRGTTPTQPQGADAGQGQQPAERVQNVQSAAEKEAKRQQREECKKMQGN
jgi:hypothetical protein